MSGIIQYLELAGSGKAETAAADGIRLHLGSDMARHLAASDLEGLAGEAGVVLTLMSYVSAPENDPPAQEPTDEPAQVPEEPDQDSEAA